MKERSKDVVGDDDRLEIILGFVRGKS